MDEAALRSSPVGRLVPIRGHDGRFGEDYDHWAFVPDPLPQVVDLSPTTWRLVGDAMLNLGRLDQAGRQVPNP
ncbi:MAG: Fic family protein, partial [Actinobacteria bacterium]|nr:Fic family protein [Actinomycetota bacterium]